MQNRLGMPSVLYSAATPRQRRNCRVDERGAAAMAEIPNRRSAVQRGSPEELLGQMTLEEKAGLLTGDSAWTTSSVPRLEIGSIRMADGPHGVRRTQRTDSMA